MTHLRKMMLEELQRRNYAETTISSYIRIVEDFSRRFQRPPDRLGPQQIREYQAELFKKRKLAASTVTVYLAALRFFYTKTLKKGWSAAETPRILWSVPIPNRFYPSNYSLRVARCRNRLRAFPLRFSGLAR